MSVRLIWPLIQAYDKQYLMNSVNKRLLALLSMVLELPRDYLWGECISTL